jgi:hypothetical protein
MNKHADRAWFVAGLVLGTAIVGVVIVAVGVNNLRKWTTG